MAATNNFYLEVKKGDKVVIRKPTTQTTFNAQWSQLAKEINDNSLDISLMVSSDKEKVFNHLVTS